MSRLSEGRPKEINKCNSLPPQDGFHVREQVGNGCLAPLMQSDIPLPARDHGAIRVRHVLVVVDLFGEIRGAIVHHMRRRAPTRSWLMVATLVIMVALIVARVVVLLIMVIIMVLVVVVIVVVLATPSQLLPQRPASAIGGALPITVAPLLPVLVPVNKTTAVASAVGVPGRPHLQAPVARHRPVHLVQLVGGRRGLLHVGGPQVLLGVVVPTEGAALSLVIHHAQHQEQQQEEGATHRTPQDGAQVALGQGRQRRRGEDSALLIVVGSGGVGAGL